ncbi:MAG TPA: polyprenyl synthetase family protein [Actinomycetota bacterium]|nr:polyprenyl synthetase family protein [Actinomycetota bacterium]
MSPSARPQWLADDMARIEHLLFEAAGASQLALVAEASTHLIKAGGKRLRPALVMISSRAGEPGRRATDLAATAIELVHLATLYHDDVIDETETRRGVPTAHAKWGTDVAVLAGDYLFASGSALGADAGGEVPGILARAIAEVCEGQIAETESAGDPLRPVDDFVDTIGKKTGALFRASCDLGAATAGASAGARAALVAFGAHLGLAFQMVDDLLDLTGDPRITGKTPGTDLKEGVYTLPVLLACRRQPGLAGRLREGRRALEDVLPVLESTGALDEALSQARLEAAAAEAALGSLPATAWRDALQEVLDGVLAQVA